jgi:hypothetical protein
MKRKIRREILLNLIVVFLLCGITACCQLKKMTSWLPFKGNETSQCSLTHEKIEKFIHTIKPADNDAESHYCTACFFQERKQHRLAV